MLGGGVCVGVRRAWAAYDRSYRDRARRAVGRSGMRARMEKASPKLIAFCRADADAIFMWGLSG